METVVIGYGNDLRSDDGAGRAVADRIESLGLPDTKVISVSQLTPELALQIDGADLVVFIDASIDVTETTMTPIQPDNARRTAVSHFAEPASLLGMAETIGTVPQRAVAVSIPVMDLALGLELSPVTEIGVDRAVDIVMGLIDR